MEMLLRLDGWWGGRATKEWTAKSSFQQKLISKSRINVFPGPVFRYATQYVSGKRKCLEIFWA